MSVRLFAALLLVIPLVVGAAAEESSEELCRPLTEDPDGPVACTTETFLQCADDEKVHVPLSRVQLDVTPPPGSYQDGHGCGQLDEPVFGSTTMDSLYELHFAGYVQGNIDTLTSELYLLGPSVGHLGEELHLDVRVAVDGESPFGPEDGESVSGDGFVLPKRVRFVTVPEVSDSGASAAVRFTIEGLGDALGTAAEPGAGEQFHFVEFSVNFPHTGDCEGLPPNGTERCMPGGPTPWVWGADEIPSGVVVNAPEDHPLGDVKQAEPQT